MKRIFTISKLTFVAFAVFCTMQLSAQIDNLDPTYYYMIQPSRNNGPGYVALGINMSDMAVDEALLEKQTPDGISAGQLWQIVPVTDSSYRFKNKASGMALGVTTWIGLRPDITDPADVWHFKWTGWWPGACQRVWNNDDPSQEWIPVKFEDLVNDTSRYRMANVDNYHDSLNVFNLWRNTAVLETDPALAYQNKNIAVVSHVRINEGSYTDYTRGYSYFFTKTIMQVPPSALNTQFTENISIYASKGTIVLQGELNGKHVDIYSILGTRIYSALANASRLDIPIKQGLYIVRAGKMITKLVVE